MLPRTTAPPTTSFSSAASPATSLQATDMSHPYQDQGTESCTWWRSFEVYFGTLHYFTWSKLELLTNSQFVLFTISFDQSLYFDGHSSGVRKNKTKQPKPSETEPLHNTVAEQTVHNCLASELHCSCRSSPLVSYAIFSLQHL